MLQKLMAIYNKNSVNNYGNDISMLSEEKQNIDILEGIHL